VREHAEGARNEGTLVSQLLSCPFCRELFESGEHTRCPECDVVLKPLSELPPSYDVLEEEAVAWEQTAPEDLALPLADLGRGRGVLAVLCLASLGVFFFARGALGWLWGGAVAWFVMLALIATRRSIRQMRGVRAVLALFAAMTMMEVVLLFVLSPRSSGGVRFDYTWTFGVYGALALSVLGVVSALRFGGSVDATEPKAKKNKHVTLRPVSDTKRTLH
jgi:hypothetical protein